MRPPHFEVAKFSLKIYAIKWIVLFVGVILMWALLIVNLISGWLVLFRSARENFARARLPLRNVLAERKILAERSPASLGRGKRCAKKQDKTGPA